MRKAELCGLRWSDLDAARSCVIVQRQLFKGGQAPVYGPGKNNRPRIVDLASETIVLLKQHRAQQAGLKMRNRLHSCATLLLSAGAPQKVVQERLGHQNIATTLDHLRACPAVDAARSCSQIGGASRRVLIHA